MREPIGRHSFELVALSIAAAVAAHAPHLPVWLCIGAPATLIARVALRRRGFGPAPLGIRLPAACLLLAAVMLHYGTLFGREPGSALGCGLLALKLLETERARDARVAIGFAGFVLMSALLFTQSLLFTVGVSLILILLLAALVSLQPAPGDARHRLRTELRIGAILLACGLPMAAAGFMLVPRLSTPLWGGKDRSSEGHTGLSDSMEPGALTELLIDDSPAFRVRFDAATPPPQQRYFRAIVLSDFDGTRWSRGRHGDFVRTEEAERDGMPVDYVITLEPTDRRWLPTLDLPFVAPSGARFSADRELIADDVVSQPREYRVRSSSRYTFAPTLSPQERSRALALPAGFDPKTRALAGGWRAEHPDDLDVVRAALDLFHASFRYTLHPELLGRDSIDDFLFSTREGFCEHYASAFVVLMRSAGIPARVVTGYQGGWWNESGGYLLVHNSDAHAWAEVWIASRGWVRVDPTAAVSPARIELGAAAANDASGWVQSAWVRAFRNHFDRINGWWTQAVIRFDALRQRGLLTPFGVGSANQGDLLVALSLALAVVLLLATLWAMREAKPPRDDALDAAWAALGRRLERAGVEPRPSEGPLDLLARARAALPTSAATLNGLVSDYVALRYGVNEPVPERVRFFTTAVRKFRVPRRVKKRKAADAVQR
jgi:transglutaminase-like putative cysteine protease